jgi:hypothetical protein
MMAVKLRAGQVSVFSIFCTRDGKVHAAENCLSCGEHALDASALQVVQRIMAGEGGIFPNRHRFMDRLPARGVLSLPRPCARLFESSRSEVSGAAGAPATDTSATSVPSTPGGSAPCLESPAGAEGAKEVARRSQACRPWVCYGNPRCASAPWLPLVSCTSCFPGLILSLLFSIFAR